MITPLHLPPNAPREALIEQIAGLDRQVFDLQSLIKAGEALFHELDVTGLCSLLVAMVRERTNMEQVAIILHDTDAGVMKVYEQAGLSEETRTLCFPATDGLLWQLMRSGDPFTVVDSKGEPRFEKLFRAYGLEALGGTIWVPLVVGGKVVGVISLGGAPRHRTNWHQDMLFIERLASLAAGALSTALLYQSVAVARRDLNRSLHNLSMLFDVTRALSAISDLNSLLKMILERAIAAVEAEKGSLMLLDETTEELVIRVVYGLPDKEAERRINDGDMECKRFRRGEGIAGKVLETGATFRVNNTDKEDDFAHKDGSHAQSLLCVPLNIDSEIIGVINITNKKSGHAFGVEDESILEALANQAAMAINRTRLYEAAITDSLTGLFVRRFIKHRLLAEVRRSRRYDAPMSVVMCDIDHFKTVNDTYGHPAGDEVIISVAQALRRGVREDVDMISRYGGEEFVVLLPQTGLEGAVKASERIREDIATSMVEAGLDIDISVTMSFGVAEFHRNDPEDTADACLKRADEALYRSKHGGRNRVTAWTHDM